jgi:hypothetical protein
MSQAFKNHIWTQLGLGYTIKQIYDKHKTIWWAKINAGEAMTRDNFIKQQNITYLNCKHKKRNLHLHKNLAISVATLTWPSVGVKPNTWKSWGFGVLRDSRMFRARQQDPKHLALGCSWCHWKGLET